METKKITKLDILIVAAVFMVFAINGLLLFMGYKLLTKLFGNG